MIRYLIITIPDKKVLSVDFEYDETKTIMDLKKCIKGNYGIPVSFQVLIENDIMFRVVNNYELLCNYSTTLEMKIESIGMMSMSRLKYDTLIDFFGPKFIKCRKFLGNDTGTEQPFGIDETFECAKKRFMNDCDMRFLISIENGIFRDDNGDVIDFCAVLMKDEETGRLFSNRKHIHSTFIKITDGNDYFDMIKDDVAETGLGFTKTIGFLLGKKYKIPKNNWMKHLNNFPREKQIYIALQGLMKEVI